MSFFNGRDCLSHETVNEQMHNMHMRRMKCIHADEDVDCECEKIVWTETAETTEPADADHSYFKPQNNIKEIDNYPAIISKYYNANYKTCPSNINDLDIDDEYKAFYSNIYEKITSVIVLFNVDKIVYDALLHNLRNKLKTLLIKYENKYLVKYNNKMCTN